MPIEKGMRGRQTASTWGDAAVDASRLVGIRKRLTDSGNGRVCLDGGQPCRGLVNEASEAKPSARDFSPSW
jgi:hypothetical protein